MAEINNVYKFNFAATDGVSKVVDNIEKSFADLSKGAGGAGVTIDDTIRQNIDSLKRLSKEYEEQKSKVKDVEERLSSLKKLAAELRQIANQNSTNEVGADAARRLKEVNREIKALSAIDTKGISDNISSLEKQLSDTAKEVGKSLKEIEKEVESAENPKSGKGDSLLKRLGFDKNGVKNFKGNLSSIARSAKSVLAGKGGLASVIGGVGGAIGGLVSAFASTALFAAINLFRNAIQKGVKALTEWIGSWGEFRRTLKEGFGNGIVETAKEISNLDTLAERLERAKKNSAEYNDVKKEIISTYGKYRANLEEEIERTGTLAGVYDQLTASIIASTMAKQADAAIDKVYEKQAEKISKIAGRQLHRLDSEEEKQGWIQYATGLTDDLPQSGRGRANRIRRKLGKASKRVERIREVFGFGESLDPVANYSELQNKLSQEQDLQDKRLKARQDEVNSQREVDQLLVNAMADGAAKQRAQAKLDYERRIEQIENWKREYIRQQSELHKAEWIASGNTAESYDPMTFWGNQTGPTKEGIQLEGIAKARAGAEQRVLQKTLADIAFETSQKMANDYGSTGQQREALIAKLEKDLKQVPAAYKEAAEKKREYELALFDYNAIKDTGNPEAERQALEKMLDAEIATLDGAKKEAAIKRKELTLAEFGKEDIEKYGNNEQRKKLLEDTLSAEVETIDKKYLQVKEAMDRLTRAEFDEDVVGQYGSRAERRSARLSTLIAEADVYRKRNGVVPGSAKDKKIIADVEFKIAQWDWEEIMDFGGFESKQKALRAKWDAYIATLDKDQRAGALKQKQKEIAELEMQSSAVYKKIFADTNGMGKEMINNVIQLAEAQLQKLIESGTASEEILKNLRDRIDDLKQSRDELDFKGWGGTIQGFLHTRNSRSELMSRRAGLIAERNALSSPALTGDASADSLAFQQYRERYAALSKAIEDADGKIKNLTADMKKEAAMLATSKLGETLGKVGDAMQKIASVSGNDSLSEAGEALSGISGMVSGIANGFATGGPIGGIAAAVTSLADMTIQAITSVKIADAEYSNFLKNFGEQIELLKLSINSDDFENAFGANSLAEAQAQWGASLKALEKYKEAVSDLRGMSVKTHDYNWLAEFFGKRDQYASLSSFDIFNTEGLDIDKARAFLETASFLTDEQKQQIENAIALKDAYDEARKAVNDYVSSLTSNTVSSIADEMLENFLSTGSAIVDMTDNMNDFGKAMAKSAIESKLLGKVFNEEAEANLAELIATGDTQGAISMYNSLLEAANAMAPEIEAFLKGINYEDLASATDRANQSSGFATMSQQSADELNGRFTGLQISATNIDETTRAIKEQNDAMFLRSGEVLLELMGIHTDTSFLRDSVGKLENACGEIQLGVKKIIRDGVRLN